MVDINSIILIPQQCGLKHNIAHAEFHAAFDTQESTNIINSACHKKKKKKSILPKYAV
jgi:hypothetical protein